MIRLATAADLPTLYEMGLQTPEIQVSSTEPFIDEDEFYDIINQPEYIFLLNEEADESAERATHSDDDRSAQPATIPSDGRRIQAFLIAYAGEANPTYKNRYGSIRYLVVHSTARHRGHAQNLYLEAERLLHQRGLTHLYCWANIASGIIPFMEKQGFTQGHQYVWMDKKL